MADFVTTLLPMFLFMLIPLWIPMIASAIGRIRDLLTTRPSGFTRVSADAASAPRMAPQRAAA